jgi:hypothetical protein
MPRSGKRHFYLLCVLPPLDTFGSVPPISKQELSLTVITSAGPIEMVQTLLLSDDLLQREAVLSGEIRPDDTDLKVLSRQQVNDSEPLPEFLIPDIENPKVPTVQPGSADRMWGKYFQYAASVAHSRRMHFLQAWVGFEVGLRNALVKARAEALEIDPRPYMVARELGDPEFHFNTILSRWKGASNPLESLEILERARWNWVTEHDEGYRFSDDEVASYTVKLMILQKFQRMASGGASQHYVPL